MDIPSANLPKALDIPHIHFRPPTADVPAYKPMIVPPADLERPQETQAEEKETTEQPEPPKLKIPVIDIEMPLPETCLLYTSPSPRDLSTSRMPSSA